MEDNQKKFKTEDDQQNDQKINQNTRLHPPKKNKIKANQYNLITK